MRSVLAACLALSGLASAASAQQWEIGGLGGFAYTPKWSVKAASGSQADAGFKSGAIVGAWGAHNGRRVGGELRYLYRYGSGELAAGGAMQTFAAHQQSATYSVLWHFSDRGAAVRPYIAFGGGARWLQGTGRQVAVPPLFQYGAFVQGTEILPVVDIGAGVKFRVGRNALIRLEIRDYFGPLPGTVLSVAPAATMSGWYHDLTPMLGIGFAF
jgi:hypothetical protein